MLAKLPGELPSSPSAATSGGEPLVSACDAILVRNPSECRFFIIVQNSFLLNITRPKIDLGPLPGGAQGDGHDRGGGSGWEGGSHRKHAGHV